jgi:toxin-antitoxin system PIN domain toxin
VILIDANLLLYAYHSRSDHHERSRSWLEDALSGRAPVRLAWWTIFAFLRIGTSPRIFEHPLRMTEAAAIVSSWLSVETVALLEPGERYWEIFTGLLRAAQVTGPLVTDAALAALAIEHGATLCTTDRDFSRFPALRTVNPLAT